MIFLVLYVDDLLITSEEHLMNMCKQELTAEFDMKDLGFLHYFLGLEIWQKGNYIFLNQGEYTIDILTKFGMMDCKPTTTPMEVSLHKLKDDVIKSESIDPTYYRKIIRSLMYLVNTQPGIFYPTNTLS